MGRIICIGDSITEGVGDNSRKDLGWPQRLKKYFSKDETERPIINLGVSGAQIKDVSSKFNNLARKTKFKADDILIVAVGTNNCHYIASNKHPGPVSSSVSLPQSKIDFMDMMIRVEKDFPGHVLVLGVLPVDEEKMPLPSMPLTDGETLSISFNNRTLCEFNETLAAMCAQLNIDFLDFWKEWSEEGLEKTHHIDGLHPNKKGYDRLGKRIHSELETLSWT